MATSASSARTLFNLPSDDEVDDHDALAELSNEFVSDLEDGSEPEVLDSATYETLAQHSKEEDSIAEFIAGAEPYQYQPLEHVQGRTSIRLLHLQPSSSFEVIDLYLIYDVDSPCNWTVADLLFGPFIHMGGTA